MKIEALAAGQDGWQDPVWLRCCQDKDGIGRWLFQRLEKGVGSLLGYHMDFVYDVYLVASDIRGIVDFLPQVADFIDAPVAGGVYLYHVQGTAFVNCPAHVTVIARFALCRFKTVHCLGQDAPGACLPGASRAAEQVGVSHPPAVHGIAQCLGDMLLSYYFRQALGTPLAVENLRSHAVPIILHVP